MNQRQLRARIVLDEARALGLNLADLIAADAAGVELPTVGSYVTEIGPTTRRSRRRAQPPRCCWLSTRVDRGEFRDRQR